ncbi:NET1-associated nuclear protein 1, partial [Coemansia aciculifera]
LQARGADHYFWVCRSIARYREQSPSAVAFSSDGSTLAVAFGGAVTLWDPAACLAPAAVLVASAQTPMLSSLAFVGESSYLAAWSSTRLDMWNLLTGSVWWTLAMPLLSVAVHPRAPLLAVAARQAPTAGPLDASLLLLNPSSPNPLVALPHPAGVEALAFVPSPFAKRGGFSVSKQLVDPLDHNLLVVLTPAGLLNLYGAVDDERKDHAVVANKPQQVSATATAISSVVFANIFGKSNKVAPAEHKAEATTANVHVRQAMRLVRSAVQSAYVNAPYHVLPPVSALYDQFVTAQMHPATSTLPPTLAEEDADMVDVEKDQEPAIAVAGTSNRPATVDDLWSEASPDFIQSICSGFQAKN